VHRPSLVHSRENHLKIRFSAGCQYVQMLSQSVRRYLHFRYIGSRIRIAGVYKHGDGVDSRYQFTHQFQVLWAQNTDQKTYTCEITAGSA
jgi:hypothetical protein